MIIYFQNSILKNSYAKGTDSEGFDSCSGSGIHQNLGLGCGLGKKTIFRIEMVEVRECGIVVKKGAEMSDQDTPSRSCQVDRAVH